MKQAVERVVLVLGVVRHRDMHGDGPRLPDAVDTIVALLLHSRVPPARQVDHVRRCRKRQPGPRRLRTENEKIKALVVVDVSLKLVYNLLATRDRGASVDQVDTR